MRHVESDFSPELIVGIRTGGLVVAEAMARAASTPVPVLPLTCRRPTTSLKSRIPGLKPMLASLPEAVRNALRHAEHRLLSGRRKDTAAPPVDRNETDAIGQWLAERPPTVRVLVADDAVDSGVTLATVLRTLRGVCPPGTQLRTAAITVTLPNPRSRPTMRFIKACSADSPGRSMRPVDPVLICDLDGTLLRGNSFPLWILYLIGGPLPETGLRRRVVLSLRVQRLLLRRKLGRIGHDHLMRGVQLAWHDSGCATNDLVEERFLRLLRRWVRPGVEALLRRIAAGEVDAILATAAAGEYANGLGRILGFRHILTTPCRLGPGETLNAGTRKLERVLAYLDARRWADRPLLLLTDHMDDLPLMRHCAAVGWFGSAAAMVRAGALADDTKFIDCRWLDAAGLARALSELSAHAASVLAETTSA